MRRRNRAGYDESTKALAAAQEGLKQTQMRGEEVTKVANSLKHIRERNHFADQLRILLGGRQ